MLEPCCCNFYRMQFESFWCTSSFFRLWLSIASISYSREVGPPEVLLLIDLGDIQALLPLQLPRIPRFSKLNELLGTVDYLVYTPTVFLKKVVTFASILPASGFPKARAPVAFYPVWVSSLSFFLGPSQKSWSLCELSTSSVKFYSSANATKLMSTLSSEIFLIS